MFYIFCSFTRLLGKEYFAKLNQHSGAVAVFFGSKKKYQEPEQEPLGKKIRSQSRSRLKKSQEPEADSLKNLPALQPWQKEFISLKITP